MKDIGRDAQGACVGRSDSKAIASTSDQSQMITVEQINWVSLSEDPGERFFARFHVSSRKRVSFLLCGSGFIFSAGGTGFFEFINSALCESNETKVSSE